MENTFKVKIAHITTFTDNAREFVFDFLAYVHHVHRNMSFQPKNRWEFNIFIINDKDNAVEHYIKSSLEYEGLEISMKFYDEKTFYSTQAIEVFINNFSDEYFD